MTRKPLMVVGLSAIAGAVACLSVSLALSAERPIPSLTLRVPRTVEIVDAATWCRGKNTVGTAKPFGFNKVRFYRDRTETKPEEYLIGCITNNSGRTLEGTLAASFVIQYQSNANRFGGGVSYLNLPKLKPGQTGFFKSEFRVETTAVGVDLELQQVVQESNNYTYKPIEKLVIRRR